MKLQIAFFSPTGTTARVLQALSDALLPVVGGTCETHDFTLPAAREQTMAFGADDLVLFGVPTYAGRVPNLILPYVQAVRGNGALAVPIVLFGNRAYDDALSELTDVLTAGGFCCIAAGAFVGEHSFSETLGAGRPDAQDLTEVRAFADKIAQKLVHPKAVQVQNDAPRVYYQPKRADGTSIDIRKVKPKTNERCVQCRLCASLCPMGAISPEDARMVPGICIKCGACIKRCPQHAKFFDDEGYLIHKAALETQFSRRADNAIFI